MVGLGWVSGAATSSTTLNILRGETGCPWSYGENLIHVKP